MLLVGYCYGIRSERRLYEQVHLAYRWFCRLGIAGEVPDHSTFFKNRHDGFRDCDLLRKLFESIQPSLVRMHDGRKRLEAALANASALTAAAVCHALATW
jgi:transposase